jgi:hypothetical protein
MNLHLTSLSSIANHFAGAGKMIARTRKAAADRTILPTPAKWLRKLTEHAYA